MLRPGTLDACGAWMRKKTSPKCFGCANAEARYVRRLRRQEATNTTQKPSAALRNADDGMLAGMGFYVQGIDDELPQ